MKSFALMLIAIIVVATFAPIIITLNTIRKVYRMESIKEYFSVIACGFDQAGGSILYSQEDWKVSSWTYYLHREGNRYATYFMQFINFLFRDQKHCENSFYKEAEELKFTASWMLSKSKEVTNVIRN
ncbi:hypothetical protein [Sulfuricurvum sp.]|uniref:hypothetical protein n=1 Tax=Sulfuricurvum sp. TaxID=2025608 RepID=UPI0026341C68|nr:hypothetical protein [Sulfuricurvum sp.]MDD2267011.1 hypothetical protein [Sulfuricurvum sp.]MDD2782627.1 hypothetical protein [Sulfuricurvum sp.]